MLRCCAGICGDLGGAPTSASALPPQQEGRQVVKPIVRVDGEEPPPAASFAVLVERLGLLPAPPGAVAPPAVVTKDFPKNSSRLLVLVPSEGAPEGSWDTSPAGRRIGVQCMLQWAEANGYAVCLFSASALFKEPSVVWDHVMKGSPAGSVAVLAATGALTVLAPALRPLHMLMIGRYRLATVPFGGGAPWPPAWPGDTPPELLQHLRGIAVQSPAAWAAEVRASTALLELFELLALKESRHQKHEARKYEGFQGLKENDMPGIRRLNAEERIQRLDRDRGNDELARLLRKHEQAGSDDEGPGVD